ncbi:hypothetical protein CY35_17G054400 [Sphagnum magellanicum]|nr:hypothetical protein CY35_17G054400 [Sphagnum magellanicum]
MAAAMLSLRAQTAGNVLACSNIVRDLSQNSQKRDVEAACLQVQTAPKQLHSLKSSSLRSTSYKQDSSLKRNSSSRITSVLEAQGRRTASKHGEIIKNPAEALMEHFGNLPSSDITHSSVTESADRLFLWESIPKLAEAQTFSVYELNEFDRDSPAFLEFSRQTVNKVDPDTGAQVHALGDQVPFTNKLYDGSLKLRLGITAGICLLMKHYPGMGTPEMKRQQFFFPDRYETLMTWYFGDFGHISGQGPFVNYQDTLMSITGGVGFFREARGVVRLHNISPFKFFYTFTLTGIPELPKHLTASVVPPSESAAAIAEAVACDPLFTLPNFSN